MPDRNEIYVAVLAGIALALLLVGFVVTIFLAYQRKRQKQEQEIILMKERYEQEALRSQLEIQEATLKSIAQELHDNIGQVLSVIKLTVATLPIAKEHEAYPGLQESRQMLNKVIYDLSDLTKGLHTDRISEIGLVDAIRFDAETLRKTGLADIHFQVQGNEHPFDGQKSIFLFRIYQEMTNNILKHAGARNIHISLQYTENNRFMMKVKDDGVGFDPKKKKDETSSSSGLGLKNMLNRAHLIGAEISIDSKPQQGTTISIEMPL